MTIKQTYKLIFMALLPIGLCVSGAQADVSGCPATSTFTSLNSYPPVTNLTEYRSQPIVPVAVLDNMASSCDQHALLAEIFANITAGSTSDYDRAVKWVTYIQTVTNHWCFSPLDSDGWGVTSPLWNLQNRSMHCGTSARLTIDGFAAGNMSARLIQLRAHQAAEVYYDGSWHLIDADDMGIGVFVRNPDGSISSVEQIVNNLTLVQNIEEAVRERGLPSCCACGSTWVSNYTAAFDHMDYGAGFNSPYIINKTATLAEERDRYYGWMHYEYVRMSTDW